MTKYRLTKTVAMIGLMGAGKSAVGKVVAKMLGAEFCDSDHEIEHAANMTVAEVFDTYGEAVFREKETLVLERLLAGPACVLSTGGGAYLKAENRALISDHGLAVWLQADLPLLWSRVRRKDTRPLLRVADPHAALAALYEARTPIYQKAEVTVSADPKYSITEMAHHVIETLVAHPSGVIKVAI